MKLVKMSQFKKYPKIYRLGFEENIEFMEFGEDTIIIEEKVDGGNGSFWIDEDGLHIGSRNRDLVQENDEKAFAKQRATLLQILKGKQISSDYIYYIEFMATHTIKYDNVPDVIGLDIRLKRSMIEGEYGLFLARDLRCQMFDELGIENVPLVWRGKISELKKLEVDKLIPKSKYYNGKAEGIVLKNYCRKSRQGNHQLYAKVVADEFKENNKAVFGGVRQKNTDTEKIVEEFCTIARINKQINKLVNEESKVLEMGLMKELPHLVAKDILAEEASNFYDSYKWLDFSEFKKRIAIKCVAVLKEKVDLK